jgi:SulP family sulfate permease
VLIYYLIPLLTKAIPSALAALVLLRAIFWDGMCPLLEKFHLNSKFTDWNLFSTIPPEAYTLIVEYAAVLAVVVLTLLTSVIADNMTKTRHNSNRELIGQGIGNMLAAFLGNPWCRSNERYRSQY